MALMGKYEDIEDFGSYWYDNPVTKTKGEFDCAIKRTGERYDFYECKYFDCKMTLGECKEEMQQLQCVKGIEVSGIGFICTGGFEFDDEHGFILLDGDCLYRQIE